MRLVDLDPRWLMEDGRRVGFIFISPCQHVDGGHSHPPTPWRQTCFVSPTPHENQEPPINLAMADLADKDGDFCWVQFCNPGCGWVVAGGIENATFETMTVTPSLDGSAGGLWHGHITNGEIVGGI